MCLAHDAGAVVERAALGPGVAMLRVDLAVTPFGVVPGAGQMVAELPEMLLRWAGVPCIILI